MKLPDANTVARLVSFVTRTMCSLEFVPASPGDPVPACWRLALLPIAGQRPLTVALFSDKAGCRALGAALTRTPPEQVDEAMIEDSLRELLNMAAGQIRREIVPDQPLGLPRIVTIESIGYDSLDPLPAFRSHRLTRSSERAHVRD